VSRVLVIGGGLAGTWAAVTASHAGAEVVLVSRAPGATALYAGGMEIAPDLEEVMANEPFHPFTRLYRDHLQLGADLEQVGAALGDLFGHTAPAARTSADLIAFTPRFVKLPKNGFELLAAVPSPHGWRLQKALEAVLRRARVEVVSGEVTGFRRAGSRLAAAVVGEKELAADSFVLAGGRFIGGGLVKSRLVHEPLLDLAVYYQGEPIVEAYPRLR